MKRLRFLLLGLAGLCVLAACKKPGTETAAGAARAPGRTPQVLLYGNWAEPQDLDPHAITGIPELHLMQAFFEGLLSEDPVDLHPVPGVAESWDVSPDGLIYTFHLRADARWSNGEIITADDFVRTYQRMLTPALGSEYSYLLWFVVGAEDYNKGKLTDFSRVGFKAPDPRTLVATLNHPTPFLLKMIASHYAWDPLPVRVIAKFGGLDKKGTAWTRPENFVGNGPFTLKEWRPNQVIVAARSATYWDRARVKLDEIRFFPVESVDTEERMFRAGQLHLTAEIPQSKIPAYRRDNPAVLHTDPWLGVYFYRCNVTRPPLNDKRVRRALALAINRESLVRDVTQGGEIPAYTVSYPGTSGYFPRAKLSGDLTEARRLLAEAGYPDGQGFPAIELLYNTHESHRAIAEAIQQMWKRNLNINITLTNQEWKVYVDAMHTQNYQMARAGWIADYVDPNVFLEIWTTGNANNDTGWSNPEYDRLAAAALAAKSEPDRYEIYQRMDALIVDELPIIPIYFYTRAHLISTKVKGYYPTLMDDHPFKYIYLED